MSDSVPYISLKEGVHIVSPNGVYLFKEFTKDGNIQVVLKNHFHGGICEEEMIYQHGSYWRNDNDENI